MLGQGVCKYYVVVIRAEIHKSLQSQSSLLAEFLIGKLLAKSRDSRVLKLTNLNPWYVHAATLEIIEVICLIATNSKSQ
jgi:hypothetical protein